jgi:hypothetical protein
MNRLSRNTAFRIGLTAVLAAASGLAIAGDAQGDTLLIERVQEKPANLPVRGMTMAQVEARYGAPGERLDPRGGQKQAWPTINRWAYPAFTVYFERSKVIDVVVNKADPDEIGPKPAAR